jgi:hypothetical protein
MTVGSFAGGGPEITSDSNPRAQELTAKGFSLNLFTKDGKLDRTLGIVMVKNTSAVLENINFRANYSNKILRECSVIRTEDVLILPSTKMREYFYECGRIQDA